MPVALDLLDRETIAAAARQAADATVLINNASTAAFAAPLDADPARVRHEMVVNYDGTFDVIRAFVPVLERNGGGAIVNVLSLLVARQHAADGRLLRLQGGRPLAHPGPAAGPDGQGHHASTASTPPASTPTCSPGSTRPRRRPGRSPKACSTGLAAEQEDIFPDPNAQAMAATWWSDPKAFERAFSGA